MSPNLPKTQSIKFGIQKKFLLLICLIHLTLTFVGVSMGYLWGANLLRNVVADEHAGMAKLLSSNLGILLDNEIEKFSTEANDTLWKETLEKSPGDYSKMDPVAMQNYFDKMDRSWIQADAQSALIKQYTQNDIAREIQEIVKTSNGHTAEFFITDKFGGLIAASGKTSDFYQADEKWWQSAYNNGRGEIYLGEFEYDESSATWSLPIACPIKDDRGQVLGVAKSVIQAKFILDKMNSYHQGKTGSINLIDDKGFSVLTLSKRKPLITEREFGQLRINPKHWITSLDLTTNKESYIALEEVVSSHRPEERHRWFIVIKQDMDEILAPLQTLVVQMGVVLGVLILLIYPLGLWVSKLFLSPINQLHEYAKKVRAGDKDSQISINTSDEIEELANTLKEMVNALSQKQLELQVSLEKALVANKLKSQFLANVSHEMRTPMHCIVNYADAIIHTESIHKAREDAKFALQEADRLLVLINDLLDNAKIDAGRLDLMFAPMDLYKDLGGIKNSMQLSAQSKNLEFNLLIDQDVPQFIVSDTLRLRQILVNLIGNAIKFTNQGSVTLKVKLIKDASVAVKIGFEVIDTGIGIAPKDQRELFQSFAQIDGSLTRKYGGVGLGTRIAKSFVTAMGGEIGVESDFGKGSRFWFVIPVKLCSASEVQHSEDHEFGSLVRKDKPMAKILFADDYLPTQNVMLTHFQNLGLDAKIVSNGRDAVKLCNKEKFDVIFLDIQMPEMDGLEAARCIRSEGSLCQEIPIIAVTASTNFEIRKQCQEAGMNSVLTKPFRPTKILSIVQRWKGQRDQGQFEDEYLSQEYNHTLQQGADLEQEDLINYDQALLEFSGNGTLLNDAMHHFINALSDQIKAMNDYLVQGRLDLIRSEAHKIRGGAVNLTAFMIANAAKKLELESFDIEQVKNHLIALEHEFNRLKKFINDKR